MSTKNIAILIFSLFTMVSGCNNTADKTTDTSDRTPPQVTAQPEGASFDKPQSISLSCDDGDGSGCAKTYYTIDGSPPTDQSLEYVSPIELSNNTTLKFIAFDNNGIESKISIEDYIFSIIGPVATATPKGRIYNTQQSIIISCVPNCKSIYYTTDESDPSIQSQLYTAPIGITNNTILKILPIVGENVEGDIVTEIYTIDTLAPSTQAIPPGGVFATTGQLKIELECKDADGVGCQSTFYTLDGSVPTIKSSKYNAPIAVSENTALRFFSIDIAGNPEPINPKPESYRFDTTSPFVSIPKLSFVGKTDIDFEVTWEAATDDSTASDALLYQLYYSTANNISSLTDITNNIEINGVAYTNLISARNVLVTGINNARDLYWNVVVSDDKGNKAVYATSLPLDIGSLDKSFNGVGFTNQTNTNGGGKDDGRAMALDNLGKIVITGSSQYLPDYLRKMTVWRYKKSGKIDLSFNNTGYVSYTYTGTDFLHTAFGQDIMVDGSKRIVVVGYTVLIGTFPQMAIWRFLDSGAVDDTGFKGGLVESLLGAGEGYAGAIEKTTGKIIVVGRSRFGTSDTSFTIWRYDSSGNLDTSSFNSPLGYYVHNNTADGYIDSYGTDVTFDSQGRIVVVGRVWKSESDARSAIWRFTTSDGKLDATLNNGKGYVIRSDYLQEMPYDKAHGVVTDLNDNIILTADANGSAATGSGTYMVVWKYNESGSLDKTFNTNTGYFRWSNGDGSAITTDRSNRIYITGNIYYSSERNEYMSIWRLDSNGVLDFSFNGSGYTSHIYDAPSGYSGGSEILLDANDSIVVGGSSAFGRNVNIWRYR